MVSWQSDLPDGAGEGVFAQRLSGLGVQPTMDFNNDFRADLPWRYGANGSNAIWQMDGFLAQAKQIITGVGDLLWQTVGGGDFNRDGKADILWRHAVSGNNVIWLMDGVTLTAGQSIGRVADTNWTIVPWRDSAVFDLPTRDTRHTAGVGEGLDYSVRSVTR